MTTSRIAKDRLQELIEALADEYTVYAPQAEGDVIAFRPIQFAEDIVLDYRNSTVSPKGLFLPRAEVLYEFDGKDFVDQTLPDEPRLIFGIRPCDCRALTMLDRVFDGEGVKDPFYVARRANTVLVALACNRPLSTCFCTAVGGDPFGEEGADILLADAGESLIAKSLTPKGETLLARHAKFFPSNKSPENWDDQAKNARDKINCALNLDGITPRLGKLFDDGIWDTVSRKCLGCGACSYLCPTCYCFDLTNEKTPAGARKVRCWDCCMFSLFTHHASGHNPRPTNAARFRQKIMHKFNYYPESYGAPSCVGCGRCIRSCPANLDIRQVLAEVLSVPNAAPGN